MLKLNQSIKVMPNVLRSNEGELNRYDGGSWSRSAYCLSLAHIPHVTLSSRRTYKVITSTSMPVGNHLMTRSSITSSYWVREKHYTENLALSSSRY